MSKISNWFLACAQWLTDRLSRLFRASGAASADGFPASAPLASTPIIKPVEPISFQASALRQSRPLASSITRQSITIAVPKSTIPPHVQKQHEDQINAQDETLFPPESESTAIDATQDSVTKGEMAEDCAADGDVIEHDAVEIDTLEPEMTDSETPESLAPDATTDEESPISDSPVSDSPVSDSQPDQMAAIHVTQSEAIFTVHNADNGGIEVQVRGETMSLGAALESLLFVADTSVEVSQFVKLLSLDTEVIEAELAKLNETYKQSARGIRLQEQNGRYRLISLPAAANLIETFLNLDLTTRLSGPALETLSVIAYRQPATRAQIEAVRGVDCGYVLRSLLQRGLIEESGRLETVGRPILYSVTELFMQHFGLTTLNDLPPLETTEAALLMQVTEMEEEG